MTSLREAYENIRKKARTMTAPTVLYNKENPLFEYIRRYKDSLKEVVVDTPKLKEQVEAVLPELLLCKRSF